MINEKKSLTKGDKPKIKLKINKWILIAIIVLVLAGMAAAYIYFLKPAKNIKTIPVIRQEMNEIIDISGTVTAEHDITLKSVSSGVVINRFAKENLRVKKGNPLLEIDPEQIRLQLTQAKITSSTNRLQAETSLSNARKTLSDSEVRHKVNVAGLTNQIDKAKSNTGFLENELKRNTYLYKEGAIPRQNVENQQQQLNQSRIDLKTAIDNFQKVKKEKGEIVSAQNAIAQSQTNLNNAIKQGNSSVSIVQDSLKRTTINAPFNGTITLWQINPGDFVVPGTPVAKFQDLEDIRLILPVNELDLPKLNFSNMVEITFDAYPVKTFKGKISWIGQSTVADSQNIQNFPVKVKFDNPGNMIKPGMSGDAQVTVSSKKNILTIPITAIHKKENKIFVNLLENNKVKEVEIKPGLSTLDLLEVKSGLKVGDKLVTEETK